MPASLVVTTLGLVLHDVNLLRLTGKRDRARDLCAFDNRRTDGRVRAVVHEQYLIEDNRVTLLEVAGELFNRNYVALRDDKLLPAGLNYGHFHVDKL